MKSFSKQRGLLLAVAALAAPAAAAQGVAPAPTSSPPALTLEQAVAVARGANPDFLATRNDLRAAHAATTAARGALLPTASVASSFGYTASGVARFGSITLSSRNPASYSSSFDVGVNYQLSGSGLMQPRAARAQEAATRQRIAGSEANLIAQVAQQYLTALQAREQVALAERELARASAYQALAEQKQQVGAGTAIDVRKAEVQTGQAEVRLLQQNAALAGEMLRLGQLMGAPLPADTRLVSEFTLFEPIWAPDSLVALALRNNPGLLSARAAQSAAATQVRAARLSYLPTLSMRAGITGYAQRLGGTDALVQGRIAQAQGAYAGCQRENLVNAAIGLPPAACGPDPSSAIVQEQIRAGVLDANSNFPFGYTRQPFSASVSISLPVFDGFQRRRQLEEARVSAEDARLQARAQELQLATNVATATLNLRASYQAAQLQARVVRSAEEQFRLASERFRYGAASSLEVTDAQVTLRQAEQARIDAVYVFHKSLAALEALVGQRLR